MFDAEWNQTTSKTFQEPVLSHGSSLSTEQQPVRVCKSAHSCLKLHDAFKLGFTLMQLTHSGFVRPEGQDSFVSSEWAEALKQPSGLWGQATQKYGR